MRKQSQWNRFALFGLIAAAVVPASCGSAAADQLWRLRAGGVWLDPDGAVERTIDGDRVRTQADDDVGLGITLERRLSHRLGLEFGAPVIANPDLGVRVANDDRVVRVNDDLAMVAFTAGINIHLTPHQRVDLYIGPFAGVVLLDDLGFLVDDERVRFSVSDELAYGAVLGIDIPVSERWGVAASARYLAFDLDPKGQDGGSTPVDFDTLALGAGVTLSF